MASNFIEILMKKCKICHYYFPQEEIEPHLSSCEPVSSRNECSKCNCDYKSDEFESHLRKCKGFYDMVSFISEYSRKKYSQNTIRKLLKILKTNSELGYSSFKGREVLRTINEENFDINHWIPTNNDYMTIECPICICNVPADDIFILSCNDSHKICYDCLYQHSVLKLNETSVLACPISSCNEIIDLKDLNWFPFPKHIIKKLVERYNTFLNSNYINENGIKCPRLNCNWATFLDSEFSVSLTCGLCGFKFCSACKRIAHYRTNCNDHSILFENWMNWCNTGRNARYIELNKIRKQNIDIRQAHERNHLLKRNWDNLRRDEQFKAVNCKLCPRCGRVVQKY
jgi:hypothetical protein